LFYNTPARRKFLKSTQTELSHISDVVFQSALSHPMIHFRLSHEKKGLIDVPAVRSLGDRILQLFGESLSDETLEAHGESPFAVSEETAPSGSLDIFLSRPPLRRNHRKDQYIFINQRPVKSPLLTHAVYDAYGAYLMKGEHPFFVLFLSIDPGRVDVNVHPTKREVRFQNAEPIHQAVRKMIREALSSETILRGADSNEVRAFSSEGRSGGEARRSPSGLQSPWAGWPEKVEEAKTSYLAEPAGRGAEKPQGEGLGISRLPLIRPLGQIYGTFLLAEIDGEFAVIDQHTAQERILYEHFLERRVSGNGPGAVQPLLVPQQIDLPLQRAGILRDALKMLEAFGWKIEEFGETTFLVREVPALATKVSIESFLLDLTEELAELEVSSQAEQPILKMIASMACHGAVRAGQPLTSEEIKALLTTYFERKTPPTCPHGRPVFIKYPLPELEKLFRRK
ncbi:MAG TPA: DNA mismatch repair endonuclease MutL, partial [Candidatus Manganitrophaceae bacterium]|nr:DNA mismatch repair endonuclease MutL [Candidatus Manganitrophaceae bacterium]